MDGYESGDERSRTLVFPASFSEALAQILIQDQPVAVADIKLDDEEAKLGLAYSLWHEGFVTTILSVPSPSEINGMKTTKSVFCGILCCF